MWSLNIEQLVGLLCPAVDVDVFSQDVGGKRVHVHKRRWFDDRVGWLRRICLADVRKDSKLDEVIDCTAPLLAFIDLKDPAAGFAAVNFKKAEAGVQTIGGLRAGQRGTNRLPNIILETFDYESGGPDRSLWLGKVKTSLVNWANGQASRIENATNDIVERHRAAIMIANCGGDPLPVAGMLINRTSTSISDIFSELRSGNEIYAPLAREASCV